MQRVNADPASFRCPACDQGVCDVSRPALIVSGGALRPARKGERNAAGSRLRRLPGLGKDGLAQLLERRPAAGSRPAEGLLITCTCGHLFLEEQPDR
jgi:hypothetical protein